MKEVTVRVSELETVFETLENTLRVCESAPADPDRGYPYATGYAVGSISTVLEVIRTLINTK